MWRSFLCLRILLAAVVTAAEPTKLRLVADLNPGQNGSGLTGFFVWDDKVWFKAGSTQGGKTVWTLYASDGSTAGTQRIKDFPVHERDGRVLFQRKNSNSGMDIWITDGTEDRSQRLAVLKRATNVVAVLKGMILVVSEDDQFGRELYALDVPDFAVPAKPKGQ